MVVDYGGILLSTVSVIIPAYNSGPYLDGAVQSVIAQTFTDWECIVVDDGSTEDLSRIEKMDSRVRLIHQENRGISMARNRGIAESTGEFIAFLDHDDLWLPAKLECQIKAMLATPELGLCYTDFAAMDAEGYYSPSPSQLITGENFLAMLKEGAPLPTTTMLRRRAIKLIGSFDPFFYPSEDQDLFLRIAQYFKVSYLPICKALYRVHGANTSKNYMICYRTMRNLAARCAITAEVRQDKAALIAAQAAIPYRRKKFFGPQAYDAARASLRSGSIGKMIVHLFRAICWSPHYTITSMVKFLFQDKVGVAQRLKYNTKLPIRDDLLAATNYDEMLQQSGSHISEGLGFTPPLSQQHAGLPKVSVIIPAYNRPEYLRQAVQSVIDQSFTDWECIVCDDGSTEKLDFVCQMDPRVRLIRQSNRGLSMARNYAMSECLGELIAFLDDDDIWLPGKLEAQVAAMNADPGVGLSYTGFRLIDSTGNIIGPGWGGALPEFGGSFPSFTMIKRSLLPIVGMFDCFCISGAENHEYFQRLRLLSGTARVPHELGLYRVGSGNTARRYRIHRRSLQNIAEKYAISARFRHDQVLYRAATGAMREYDRFLASNAYNAGRESWRHRRILETAGHIFWALRIKPMQTIRSLVLFSQECTSKFLGRGKRNLDAQGDSPV